MHLMFIAYDRHNVIVYGVTGPKISGLKSFFLIMFCWTYSVAVCIPPYFGWGSYKLGIQKSKFIMISYNLYIMFFIHISFRGPVYHMQLRIRY